MGKNQVLIDITLLNKAFKRGELEEQVLKDIHLQVNAGEFIAITGKSGSGKSTLLSIIGLLDDFQSGEYLLCGQDITTLDRYQLAVLRNTNIGWIFQNFNLVSDMTSIENVMLPLTFDAKRNQSVYHSLAMEALVQVGLNEQAEYFPAQLSGGQQQRVAIARAIVNQPDILLADEPTGNLDSENEQRIFELLVKMNSAGTTVLMVTHSPQLSNRCSRQIKLIDGYIS